MRGIILAGGTGSRLGALAKVTNKHLLPVGPAPMIYHPIAQFLLNGVTEICIVSGTTHLGLVVGLLGSGSRFGCNFTYKVQDAAGGVAEALSLCKDFAADDDIWVFLGDNIFGKVLSPSKGDCDGMLFLKQVPDPHRFGIAEVDHMKILVDLEEKPENPKSNMAVIGSYVYSSKVWNYMDKIERSPRGELEITDINKLMLKENAMTYNEVYGWWSDAGTQESYRKANKEVWAALDDQLMAKLQDMMKDV